MPLRRRITGQGRSISANFVGYARKSTPQQPSASLERQEAAIRAYVEERGGHLLAQYTETASETDRHEGERERAIEHAIRAGAILLVLWPDRLTRAVHRLSEWRARGLRVRAVAYPLESYEQFRRRVWIAYAENEERAEQRELARHQARREGRPWGDPNRGGPRRKRAATRDGLILILLRHALGNRFYRDSQFTLQEIAQCLTEWQVRTPSGRASTWEPTQVRRVLMKAEVRSPGFRYYYPRHILRERVGPEIFLNYDAYEMWMAMYCGSTS